MIFITIVDTISECSGSEAKCIINDDIRLYNYTIYILRKMIIISLNGIIIKAQC